MSVTVTSNGYVIGFRVVGGTLWNAGVNGGGSTPEEAGKAWALAGCPGPWRATPDAQLALINSVYANPLQIVSSTPADDSATEWFVVHKVVTETREPGLRTDETKYVRDF